MHIGLSSRVEVGIGNRGIIDSSIDSTIGNGGAHERGSSSNRGSGIGGSSNWSNTSIGNLGSGSVAIGRGVCIGVGQKGGLGRDRGHEGKNSNKGFHFSDAL